MSLAMRFPRRLTRAIEARLLREAEERVRSEVATLAALQAELRRIEARYGNRIAANGGAGLGEGGASTGSLDADPEAEDADDSESLRSVSFEDLRDLGLSVSEATRILASRYRGELTSVADLDEMPGLSRSVRRTLRERLHD